MNCKMFFRLSTFVLCLGMVPALWAPTPWTNVVAAQDAAAENAGQEDLDKATELQASDLLVMHACKMADQVTMTSQDAAMAKMFASEALGRAADHTVLIYGGMGLMELLPVERLWRDARLERIWDGTSEIQRLIISRSLLRQYESD